MFKAELDEKFVLDPRLLVNIIASTMWSKQEKSNKPCNKEKPLKQVKSEAV